MAYRVNLASDMRCRAVIRQKVQAETRDKLGQYPVEEQTVDTVWAKVTPMTGSLLTGRAAETELSRTTHKITVRWRPDLRPDMWFVVEGEIYDILYIMDPYHDHKTLEIFCEVRVGEH